MSEPIHVRARKFLQQFFSDEELTNFCFDYFPLVYNDFTTGMPKSQKVRMLVENSQRRGRFEELLAALERERSKSYPDHFAEQPQKIDPEPEPPDTIERNPRQIFISHAHQDADFAQRLTTDLRTNGWQTWMAPDNIRPGEKWVEAINRGLAESGVFILLLTPDAVTSRWVRSEMNVAIGMDHREEIRLLPLNVKPADTPALWQAYQWIGFDGNYDVSLAALLNELGPRKVRSTEPIKTKLPSEQQSQVEAKEEGASSAQKTFNERIKTVPTYWFYVGGGFILLLVLLMSFWPERENGSVDTPIEMAEVIVETTEEPEATNTSQPIPSETPPNEPTSSTVESRRTSSSTATVNPNLPPPDAVLGDTWIRPKDQMVMVYVPAPDEAFELGSGIDAPMEGYWIDKYEISNVQYQQCVADGVCEPSRTESLSDYNQPSFAVGGVDFINAERYANWVGGSLPNEGQWEYAAVGNNNWNYPWGNDFDGSFLNFCDVNCSISLIKNINWNDNYRYVAPIDGFSAGASWVGVFNMSGNIAEWVIAQEGEQEDLFMLCGGAYSYSQFSTRVTDRKYDVPTSNLYDYGFRVVFPSFPTS